ncbi:Mediator of RNA polymerase II transcription subunit 15a [Euphorbia peplus]|nr:Mediator of RNA polymerase II transcription subunit 15a [Euphorbia peplus]
MDTDHPKPGDEPSVGTGGDWRTHLSPDARQTIINKITDTLAKHLPFSVEEGLEELKKLAARFEEKNYSAATSQSDYLKRISLKMVAMESKSQNTVSNSLQPNTTMPLDSRGNKNYTL